MSDEIKEEVMLKRETTMADGRRKMIYFTFTGASEESDKAPKEIAADKKPQEGVNE
jgi:hypothetical protein